jgi:hypothetical protein
MTEQGAIPLLCSLRAFAPEPKGKHPLGNSDRFVPPALRWLGGEREEGSEELLSLGTQVQGRWITLGSARDQDIRVGEEDGGVGRAHLRFTIREGRLLVQGRMQRGGYSINGQSYNDCTARPMADGDVLEFGSKLRFRLEWPG